MDIVATTSIIELQHSIDQFQIAQGYFSSILTSQTTIFSIIVAGIITLYFFFNWKISKEEIRKESGIIFKELKAQIEKEFEEKTIRLQEEFSDGISRHENEITTLNGSVFRTLGEFWYSEKKYAVSFIWWLRSAHKFAMSGNGRLTRIALEKGKESAERITYAYQLDSEWVGEYQKLILEISDEYKIEKELLDGAIKEALKRKAPDSTL